MKKIIGLFFIFIILLTSENVANAVLTNQAPTKYKNIQPKPSNNTQSTKKYNSVPTISSAQKQKYYNEYIQYLEQTIKDLGCFTSSEIKNADITVNLTFDYNYNITEASVNVYSHYGVDIDRTLYNNKCRRCESKIFMTNFKPFDNKYADGQHSTREFYITLKSLDAQKEMAAEQIIDSIKDYWSPTSNSSSCIAKITLTFGKESFAMKSYSIISSSGDNEYNQMVSVALRRWMSKLNWNMLCDYNHSIGDTTIYLKFSGDRITTCSAPQNNTNNYYQNNNLPNKSSIPIFPTAEQMMFNGGNSMFP